jgi:DNA-binding IclR family transcriptional regulator
MSGTDPRRAPESAHVARTLHALELLILRASTASEVAQALGVHRRTAHRLLESFVAEGYAARWGPDSAHYEATMKIVGLAGRLLDRTDLAQVAFPYVTRLRNQVDEAAHLSIPVEDGVMHLLQETGGNVVMVKPRVGEIVAYHSTAVGKALLAFEPEAAERRLREPLEAFTENTITNPGELLLELARIRSRAYAVDELENTLDLRCVAAPVFDHTRTPVAALGISAPAVRLTPEHVPAVGVAVAGVAEALSEALGFVREHEADRPPAARTRSERSGVLTEEDPHG